jgi:hypothetical protein
MPTIKRPSPNDIFLCCRAGLNQTVEATPVVEYPSNRPEQWTAVFPDNSRIFWNTNRWKAFDMFHPKGWVRTGAFYYPADCAERFPAAESGETYKAYVDRCKLMKLEALDQLTEKQLKAIFTEKNGILQKAEERKEMIAKAKAANPKKNYPPVALPG